MNRMSVKSLLGRKFLTGFWKMEKQWLKEAAKGCVVGVREVRTMPVSEARASALCSPQRCPIRAGGS